MKKIKMFLLIVLLVAVVVGGIWVFINRKDLRSFQQMPSGAYSKFMCSALFVEGMPEDQARNFSRVSVPVIELQIDYENKSVTTWSLFHTSTARYINERFGCTLE